MTNKERKRRMAHEALVILGMLALLTFICRLWPILLLIILGIFIAAIRLLFLSSQNVEAVEIMPIPQQPQREPSETDVRDFAYAVILRRVTELVTDEYPDARWVWENPKAQKCIEQGENVFILLNRAGGYRRAKVRLHNLQVIGLEFQQTSQTDAVQTAVDEVDASDTAITAEESTVPQKENYELLAFEWVEAYIMALNERCNEAIGQGKSELLLTADELPVAESWKDICAELRRAELIDVECTAEGIKINLTQ